MHSHFSSLPVSEFWHSRTTAFLIWKLFQSCLLVKNDLWSNYPSCIARPCMHEVSFSFAYLKCRLYEGLYEENMKDMKDSWATTLLSFTKAHQERNKMVKLGERKTAILSHKCTSKYGHVSVMTRVVYMWAFL